jgi:hypothetical protein
MTHRTRDATRIDPARAGARPMTGPRPSPHVVGVTCGVMCAAALAGVVGLAGGGLDLGPEVTARIPARSPALGAVALGLVVAVPMGAAAAAGWRRSRWTPTLATFAGTALIGWIAVEITLIRTFSWLQPACAVYGAVVLALAELLRRSDGLIRR